jgi:hypothetical protein
MIVNIKRIVVIFLGLFLSFVVVSWSVSCNKTNSNTPAADSGIIYFHLHTNVGDSTIGGNPGPDSTAWELDKDTTGRNIYLTVPQFFVSNITLTTATGGSVTIPNVRLLKGLDSEDCYVGKVPVGTYVAASFSIGIDNASNAIAPSVLFVTDSNAVPLESSMWYGSTTSGYMGMKVQGYYDTTAAHNGVIAQSIPFSFELPNSLTVGKTVRLPTRGTGSYATYRPYVVTAGSTSYIHILCDYGILLSAIYLKTSTYTDGISVNVPVADSLANNIPNMFRYEE